MESLERRYLLADATAVGKSLALLDERLDFARENFYVFRDADSAFNHGFPSGKFAGPPNREQQLRDAWNGRIASTIR